jgi:hypothetical protein
MILLWGQFGIAEIKPELWVDGPGDLGGTKARPKRPPEQD